MSNKGTAGESIARMKKEKAAAHAAAQDQKKNDGSPDFSEIAQKLEEIKAQTAKGENEGHVKMTIYVREDIARSFNALITKRGQQKAFVNQALSDFIQKKSIELGL